MAKKGSRKSTCSICGNLRDAKRDSWCKKCRKEFKENRRKRSICVDCGLNRISEKSNSVCEACLLRKNKKSIERRTRAKTQAIEFLGGKCVDCNLKTDFIAVYDFHHINPKEKDIEVSKLLHLSFEKALDELKKCVLLCANCHRIRRTVEI